MKRYIDDLSVTGRYYKGRLSTAADQLASIEPSARDPRVLAMRAMWMAARSGVLEENVRQATDELRATVLAYDKALKRWLLN